MHCRLEHHLIHTSTLYILTKQSQENFKLGFIKCQHKNIKAKFMMRIFWIFPLDFDQTGKLCRLITACFENFDSYVGIILWRKLGYSWILMMIISKDCTWSNWSCGCYSWKVISTHSCDFAGYLASYEGNCFSNDLKSFLKFRDFVSVRLANADITCWKHEKVREKIPFEYSMVHQEHYWHKLQFKN